MIYRKSEIIFKQDEAQVKELAKENRDITPVVVAEKVQDHSFFDDFKVQLEELPPEEIMISPDTLKNVKVQYKLSNEIIINGLLKADVDSTASVGEKKDIQIPKEIIRSFDWFTKTFSANAKELSFVEIGFLVDDLVAVSVPIALSIEIYLNKIEYS